MPFLQTIHWLFFLHVRADHDGGKQFIGRIRCKTSCGIWKWWSENHTVIYLFKTKIFYGYLNRHIFMRNTEKGTTVTPSRRIDKCPTLGHRFSDKFPTTGTDKMTNAREGMGTLGINRGIDWAIKFSHVDLTSAWVVYHLPQILGNSGWDVNGKRFFGSSHWKIPGTNGNSEKVVPFSRLGRSEWKFVYHLQVSWVSY